MSAGSLLFLLALLLLLAGILLFNRLIKDRNRVQSAWSDIDVQLTRRHELIPLLVKAVRAYADHERATMAAVTELRSQSAAAKRLAEKAGLEDQLASGLRKLVLLAESYPDLKANQNFLDLQKQLVEVEDHLQYARRFYNGSVRILNTRVETFPDLLIARLFRINPAEFFEAETRAAPEVSV